MRGLRPSERDMRAHLERLLETRDAAVHVEADPVRFPRRYDDPADQEVVGLLASSLAFGRVTSIGNSVQRVLDVLGPRPAEGIRVGEAELRRALDGFVHRVYRGEHVARMLHRAAELQSSYGSLGAFVDERYRSHGELRDALADLTDFLRGSGAAPRGLAHLLPDPRRGSACKRLLLYTRWMVRAEDGVDLGLWPLPTSALVMPVDTHIHRIARNLGLTTRNDASWRTAMEITARLARLDPDDPVKYDFALCHLGVSRDCPSRRDDVRCASCVLRPVCEAYARAT